MEIRKDLEDVKIEGIQIEFFQTKANSFIVGTVYQLPETSKYLPRTFNDIFNNNLVTAKNLSKEVILSGDINTILIEIATIHRVLLLMSYL